MLGWGIRRALGLGASERINPDGAITRLPYPYGMFFTADEKRILGYMTLQNMLAPPSKVDQWVPKETAFVSFNLQQAERKGVPQNGSAARFAWRILKELIMPDPKKTPSTADFIETGIVCAVIGFLVVVLIEHLFGDPWPMAAIRGAVIAVSIATVLTIFNIRKARSGATRS